ncbi:MAG: beta-ketoacyl-ACP synthase II [Desulfonatronovibrionaceae bacterium]
MRTEDSSRVVITGLGAITPLALGAEASWERMLNGVSGITPVQGFDVTGLRTRIAGQITGFDPAEFMDRRFVRRFDRSIQLGLACALMALEDAGLKISEGRAAGTGVFMGNALGGRNLLEENLIRMYEGGSKRVSPYFIAGSLASIISGQIAISIGAKGPNLTVNAACASGAHALACGLKAIRCKECDCVLAGGCEAGLTRLTFLGYDSMKVTSAANAAPAKASRPFDRDRDGFVPAEGAAVLVLESMASARERNAYIYSELAGCGSSCDAYHVTTPDPGAKGPELCMQSALDHAGISSREVDCISAHGTATKLNDIAETKAIKAVFGSMSPKIPVTASKSMLGHMIGAAGAAEAVFSVLSIRDGVIPPTINHELPDEGCDLDYVPGQKRNRDVTCVLSNSFGFGGNNTALIFKKL